MCRCGLLLPVAAGLLLATFLGCRHSPADNAAKSENAVRVSGSDTMIELAQAWAKKYHKVHPSVTVSVSGGGSGVGIASLIDGNTDLVDSSRKLTKDEIQRATASRGVAPLEHVVGYDAMAIYVHKDNPLDTITVEQLAEIYGEDGKITTWSELGVKTPGADKIIRVSRQNSSGTYAYFRETVLGKGRDFKLGSIDQNGSKDVVALVSRTPQAIGYSGMGFATPEVKVLKVAKKKGEPGVAPTVANAKNGSYPITRPLLIYTSGKAAGAAGQYLDWIRGAEGQKILAELGYVPLDAHE